MRPRYYACVTIYSSKEGRELRVKPDVARRDERIIPFEKGKNGKPEQWKDVV